MARAAGFGFDDLNERERLIVELLAAGNTLRDTARGAGVTEKTVWSYRQRKRIQDAIFNRQAEMFDGTGGQGLSILPDVVRTLRTIVQDTNERTSDRIQACRTLIGAANEYQARRQLERQIRELERHLYQQPAGTGAPEPPTDSPEPPTVETYDIEPQPPARPQLPPPEDDEEPTEVLEPTVLLHPAEALIERLQAEGRTT